MSKPKLTYFDFSGSRGEKCRMALFLAGVDFEDHRIKREIWRTLKGETPFGGLPILEVPNRPTLAHSIPILTYVGRAHGLHASYRPMGGCATRGCDAQRGGSTGGHVAARLGQG